MRPREVALIEGTTGTPTQEPAAKAAAKPSAAPIVIKPAIAAPAMAYAPVADGGGLDRFLATLAPSQTTGEPVAPEDAAAYNARKNHYSIEVHLSQRKLFLYENLPDGSRHLARSYVVAVPGRDMEAPQGWGVVTGISFEPSWRPTPAMKERALKKGKPLPEYVGPGVKDNPMGPFKIILSHGYGFRIHGNNNPNSIGRPVTSGCIRMRNDEGKDMAKLIDVGTEVVFLD
ncbi:MAG TPA: L,D-transpeptidase [Solidesulfovibrio magneticus]|nr:L,D-transpeptidase [Solidesulfovibrio magneticus]